MKSLQALGIVPVERLNPLLVTRHFRLNDPESEYSFGFLSQSSLSNEAFQMIANRILRVRRICLNPLLVTRHFRSLALTSSRSFMGGSLNPLLVTRHFR